MFGQVSRQLRNRLPANYVIWTDFCPRPNFHLATHDYEVEEKKYLVVELVRYNSHYAMSCAKLAKKSKFHLATIDYDVTIFIKQPLL